VPDAELECRLTDTAYNENALETGKQKGVGPFFLHFCEGGQERRSPALGSFPGQHGLR
jgi:hypothetical protein